MTDRPHKPDLAVPRLTRGVAAVGLAVGVATLVGLVRHLRVKAGQRAGLLPPVGAATRTLPPPHEGRLSRALANWVPARPRRLVGRLAAAMCASPGTMLGAAVGATTGGIWRRDEEHGFWLVEGGEGGALHLLRLLGFEANALGQVVLSRRRPIAPIVAAHEAVHVRQWERLGIVFAPLYLWLWARRGYRDHPFERAARRGAARAEASVVRPPPSRVPRGEMRQDHGRHG